jgi:hypothetical protein
VVLQQHHKKEVLVMVESVTVRQGVLQLQIQVAAGVLVLTTLGQTAAQAAPALSS